MISFCDRDNNKPCDDNEEGVFPEDVFPEDVFPEDVFPPDVFPRHRKNEDCLSWPVQ